MAGDEIEVFRGTGGEPAQAFFESVLRGAGISCVVKSSGVAQHPMNVGPMSEFVILVAPEDEERARAIVAELEHPSDVPGGSDSEEALPKGGRLGRRSTPGQQRAFLAVSVACAALALYLLIPYREASIFGILLLVASVLFFAMSRPASG